MKAMAQIIDFNTAPLQAEPDGAEDRDARLARIRREVDLRAEDICRYLLPGGVRRGPEFVAGDVYGVPGASLSVSLRDGRRGVWSDFATSQSGSDLIDLWQAARGVDFKAALDQIEDYLGSAPAPSARPVIPADRGPELPPPTKTWSYLDASGRVIAQVTRYDMPDGKKEFRPWDVATRKTRHPDIRPLYNLPGILPAARVVLVEGEKCADALNEIGIPATTVMGGSNAPPDKTDWSPLFGKEVLIWPDNDEPGLKYAEAAAGAILSAGGRPATLPIPDGKPAKWDAADAVAERFDVRAWLATVAPQKQGLDLSAWDAVEICKGEAPPRQWLVDQTIPLSAVTLFAAAGDTGKGMILLDLALKVAGSYECDDLLDEGLVAFGHSVVAHGAAVVFTAEDERDEVHRRMVQIDGRGLLATTGGRLRVVPLPNAGGPFPIITGHNTYVTTPAYQAVRRQLLSIPDLKLIVFDPLASFAQADINADPAAGAFLTGVLSALATETGAAVVVAHHMGKVGKDVITSPEMARDKIRGTSALVDGVRTAYCLWPLADKSRAKMICQALGAPFAPNQVFKGAVVKSNGPADRTVKTYVRNLQGLLEAKDAIIRNIEIMEDSAREMLVEAIALAAKCGRPMTKTGNNGPFERRSELPEEIQDRWSRDKMVAVLEDLLAAKMIYQCSRKGTVAKWLDVRGGPFFLGIGEIEQGFLDA